MEGDAMASDTLKREGLTRAPETTAEIDVGRPIQTGVFHVWQGTMAEIEREPGGSQWLVYVADLRRLLRGQAPFDLKPMEPARPLPDVETLRKWMGDQTPVFLTFDRGEQMVANGDLPASRSVGKARIMEVNAGLVAIDVDGYRWCFCFRAEGASPMLPVLTSIGPRRDTVQSPPERPWVKATDPVVETWIGREIELTAAHTAPWPGRLRSVGFAELLVDYNDHGDVVIQRVPREHTDVRLIGDAP